MVTKMQEKRANDDRKQIRFGLLLEQINSARGEVPLGTWVKLACKEKLIRDHIKPEETTTTQ